MKHKFVLVSASVFAMSGLVSVAHATSLDDVCNKTITEDTKVTIGGDFSGDCEIEVKNARLEIRGVTIAIDGELRIDDATEDGGAAELVIKNAKITTDDKLRIEEAWDGGVTFKNNWVDTGDDLRVKPIGSGDLIFKNNRGQVVDDIRLGDVIKEEDDSETIVGGLAGDMDVRNNRITMVNKEDAEDRTEFVAQSFDGHIDVRNNRFGNRVEEIDIKSSGSGDIGIKNNRFINTETVQEEIFIISEGGDVGVWNNTFGESVNEVNIDIDATTAQCESKHNRPELIDQFACPTP
jgi:hypothetical protein